MDSEFKGLLFLWIAVATIVFSISTCTYKVAESRNAIEMAKIKCEQSSQ